MANTIVIEQEINEREETDFARPKHIGSMSYFLAVKKKQRGGREAGQQGGKF